MKIETSLAQKLPNGDLADVTMFGDTESGLIMVAWVTGLKLRGNYGDCGTFHSITFTLSGDMLSDFFLWWGYDLSQPYFTKGKS